MKKSFIIFFLLITFCLTFSYAQVQPPKISDAKKQEYSVRVEQLKNRIDKLTGNLPASQKKPRRTRVSPVSNFKATKATSVPKSWAQLHSKMLAQQPKVRTAVTRPSTARVMADEVPTTLYVNIEASGEIQDGGSWETAYVELADALLFAQNNAGVEQIWVTKGIYRPLYDPFGVEDSFDPRSNTFRLPPNVQIYGGFDGFETSLAERKLNIYGSSYQGYEYENFATVLSGDLQADDATENARSDNSYHVVTSLGDVGTTSLDGFVIISGNANGELVEEDDETYAILGSGGGLLAFDSSPRLTNLVISDHRATRGGGVAAYNSDFILTNSFVSNNNASEKGGGLYLVDSAPILTNDDIVANSAGTFGGGLCLEGSGTAAVIRNSILYFNTALSNAHIRINGEASASFAYSIVTGSGGSGAGWNAEYGQDLGHNLDADPRFYAIQDNPLRLKPGSPAINRGNNQYFEAGQQPDLTAVTTDPAGRQRILANTIDIGALESVYEDLSTPLQPGADGILYVKKGSTGDGSSWDNAAGEVADALFAANIISGVQEIWVAGGVYHPLYRPDNFSNSDPKSRYNTFLLVEGVAVYGGFAGNETSPDQRNLGNVENASILSGDFNKNDGEEFSDLFNPDSENAYQVVTAVSALQTILLDGFTVMGGNNLAVNPNEPLVIHDTEVASGAASGILVWAGTVDLYDIVLKHNVGVLGGGLTALGYVSFSNVAVFRNIGYGISSGILLLPESQMFVLNATITQNISITNGPAVAMLGAAGEILNSIIYSNFMGHGFDQESGLEDNFIPQGSFVGISASLIGGSGGSSNWQFPYVFSESDIEDRGGNLDEDPVFADPFRADFTLTTCSRAVDAGMPEGGFFYATKDLVGNPRIFNGKIDMGAYELQALQTPADIGLAGDGVESVFEFTDNTPHLFKAEVGVCTADLLTLQTLNFTGEINARVFRDFEVESFNNAFYLQRHYDIMPTDEVENARAKVTLYFTQAEFDALNAKLEQSDYLPTGNATGEAERKSNLRIFQFHGESCCGTGMPDSYNEGRTTINPADEDIVWNAEKSRWEVTFTINGFSGFFAGTASQNPLPVRLISFEGKQNDDEEVALAWKVTEQVGIAAYQVEYSSNGKTFSKIGEVAANTLASSEYAYLDALAGAGDRAYYRLKIAELDGTSSYSKIISVKLRPAKSLIAYPNPTRNELRIDWKKTNAMSAELVDMKGTIFKTIQKTSSSQKVDVSSLPAGLYLLKINGTSGVKVVKE